MSLRHTHSPRSGALFPLNTHSHEDRHEFSGLARFQAARLASLEALSSLNLTADDVDRRGLHPDVGEVTVGQLLATWVAHDLTHLAQVAEVLARRYRDDVGPWRAYLPALDRVAEAE